MFKRTLIVLEPGLQQPVTVIQRGLAMARACLAEVVFCTPRPRARAPAADAPGPDAAAPRGGPDEGRDLTEPLHRQALRAAEALDVPCRSVLAVAEDPASAILDAARANHCDAIVVGSDGSNAVLRLLNGSSIPGLVTASNVPVMICPPAAPDAPDPRIAMRRILVVLEDGEAAGEAQTRALDLARELAAELLFVHVMPPSIFPVVDAAGFAGPADATLDEEVKAQSRRLLAQAGIAAAKAGLRATTMSLPAGTAAKDLARLAVERACELIVVAHRGRNAVMRLLTGSLVPGVITAAATPVLVCREPERPPRRRTPRRRHRRHRAAAAGAAARVAHGPGH